MDGMLMNFIGNAGTVQKAVFLMVCGVVFVFLVQVVFYLTIKLWPKGK